MATLKKTRERKVVRQSEFVLRADHKEKPNAMPSMTVPDESYTIKELFERFARGQSTGARFREGSYNMDDRNDDFDSPDLEKVKTMDPVDRDALANEVATRTQGLQKKYVDDQNRLKQKQDEENKLSSEIKQDYLQRKKESAAGAGDRPAKPAKGDKE